MALTTLLANLDWDAVTYGVTLENWLLAAGAAVAATALLWLVQFGVRTFTKKAADTENSVDDLVRHVLRETRLLVMILVGLFVGTLLLQFADSATLEERELVDSIKAFFEATAVIAVLIQLGLYGTSVVSFFAKRAHGKQTESAKQTTIYALSFVAKAVIWSLIGILVLSNLGVNVAALIAGLGVGGIAVALATQKILGDLFASVVMMFDRPFDIGDFIKVGEQMGTVEKIGLKTTKIRSLSGELLIVSNSDLLDSRIHNYKRMTERRIAFEFGVTYSTKADHLEQLPGWVKEIIESTPNTRFDRAHFNKFADSSLTFAVVYYITEPAYLTYMDAQQTINLGLARRLEENGIEFAFPTRTLHIHQESPAPSAAQ